MNKLPVGKTPLVATPVLVRGLSSWKNGDSIRLGFVGEPN